MGFYLIKKSQPLKNPFKREEIDLKDNIDEKWIKKSLKLSRFSALILMIFSLIIILGWILNITLLKGQILGSPATRMSTAFLFFIFGILVYSCHCLERISKFKNIITLLGTIFFLYGLLSAIMNLYGSYFPLYQTIMLNSPSYIDHPRFLSSINIILFGIALIFYSRKIAIKAAQILIIISLLVTYLALLTFLFNLGQTNSTYFYNHMAIYSVFLNLFMGFGLLMVYPREGIIKTFHCRGLGAYMARSLLPLSILVISIFGTLASSGEKIGLFSEYFGEVVVITFMVGFLFYLILRSAKRINQLDLANQRSQRQMMYMEKFFEDIIEGIVHGIMVCDAQNRIIYMNNGMGKLLQLKKDDLNLKNILNDPDILDIFNIKDYYLQAKEKLNPVFIKSIDITTQKKKITASGWIIPRNVKSEFDGAIITASDITKIIETKKELESSLKEKELLLAEIHHRVKNNMQIISSIMRLQSNSIDNETAQNIILDSQNRIRTMAMVHETLYSSENFSSINISNYLSNLIQGIRGSYHQSDLITFEVFAEEIELEIDTAIPVGLIINELVTNSIKHAFPDGKSGKIEIKFKKINSHYSLMVRDDGVGLPEDMEFDKSPNLGIKIINALTDQLDGDIKVTRNHGTCVLITFKDVYYSPKD